MVTTLIEHFTENSDFSNTLPKNSAYSADIGYRAFSPLEGESRNTPAQCTMFPRLLCFLTLIISFAIPCFAQQRGSGSDKFTAEILKATLYAKTDEEKQFCDYVILKRDDGTIPHRLFYAVYQKAMTQERGRRFAYFKAALEFLCRQEGIVLYPKPTKTSSTTSPSVSSRISSVFKGLF